MRLPQLQARPQRAERPSLDTVRPTDLGLGAVAQDVAAWQGEVDQTRELELEVQRDEDEKAVEPIVSDLQTRFEEQFGAKGAEWDGIEPGFARGIQSDFEAYASSVLNRDDLPPGQVDALQRRVSQYREATGQRAIQFESQRRGQRAAEVAAARDATALGGVMAAYTEQFGAAKGERDAAYDGSSPDYTAGVLADHDRIAAERIAAAPEALRPRVEQQMQATRLRLIGEAMDFEARGEQAHVAGQVRTAGAALVNGVLSAPSQYETAVANVDQVIAGLPAAAKGAARAGLLNDLTEGYVEGLIRAGEQDRALGLLNGGTLDGRLNPDAKARLMGQATRRSEELSVDDWMGRLRLQQAMQDNLASTAITGVGNGTDAATVAGVLGAREAAEYQLRLDEAGRVHASTAGFGQMTAGQIREQVAALAPQPGQAGFAEAQQRYQAASQAAEAEIRQREEDPAAWALRNAPSLAGGLSALGDGDPVAARREAGAYALGQLTLQETAGIPAAERRILPKSTASALVAAAEQNADPTAGLIGLGQVIEAFAPPAGADGATITAAINRQRMVIGEIKAAGGDNGDIAAAVDLAGDPVRLGRYVAADRGRALETLPRSSAREVDQAEIAAAVDAELNPYLRSFEGMPVSAALTGGRRLMAQRLAAEHVARRGGSVRDAAREAAEVVAGNFVFVGPTGWRMPATIAGRRDPGRGGPDGSHQVLAQRGASRVLGSLTRDGGAGFYTPADNGQGLTAAQRRERYADSVTARGRWVTTPDDAGLVLMHPALDGTMTPALSADGRPITRSWAALVDGGRDRRTRGGGTGGRGQAPRGIRNNNPGNIEANPNTRWQGQTGSDGRFATFQTPEHGLRALSRDIGTKMARGQTSIASILTQYAPPGENNTAAYIAAVARAVGVAPTARLDPNDAAVRAQLMAAIVQHENGDQPYAIPLIQEAARQGMRR